MQRGQKLSAQEMNWAFSHGGFYFHQQAGLHNRRLRMREEADAKKQGVVTESNDNAEQKVSGTGVTEGATKDGKLVQDANVQNLNVQQTNVLSDNVQNLNVQGNNAQNSNAQTETVSANVKQESSTNEPVLTNAERNEAVKENGQVVNADATQNAVEQPGVGVVQPKVEDVGEEKKRKETQVKQAANQIKENEKTEALHSEQSTTITPDKQKEEEQKVTAEAKKQTEQTTVPEKQSTETTNQVKGSEALVPPVE
ncbi:MAG: hypothetical protein ACK5Z2_14540, partial [Bacteroidota bacterium]